MSREHEIRVDFNPSGQSVYVLPGTLLLEAAERAGVAIENACDGRGTCGKCRVKIISGRVQSNDQPGLGREDAARGYRLACRTRVLEDSVVELPAIAARSEQHQVLTSRAAFEQLRLAPGIARQDFRLAPPSREAAQADAERLAAALGDCRIPYRILKEHPRQLRAMDWQGIALLRGNELIGLDEASSHAGIYGIAFDIGSTTIVGALFDLESADELAVASELNPQVKYGADVVSRIERVRGNAELLPELQGLVLDAVRRIIRQLSGQAGVSAGRIYRLALAGNSTMQQLLLGIDPSPLGELPFTQAFARHQRVAADDLELACNPAAEVLIMPQIGGFVGGDTVAAMAAAGIERCSGPTLLIDIGTNGELVLSDGQSISAASAAAGPAFEGARIEQGMRAAEGAIEKVAVKDGKLLINVIGDRPPIGLCGTALIDAIAVLLDLGILAPDGRLRDRSGMPAGITDDLAGRIVETSNGKAFVLAREQESGGDRPIAISERDISEAQLCVGAIRAGINLLLRRHGLRAADLKEVLLAGAFGNYIRKQNARRIGLIPNIPTECIRFIGNAALHGAVRILLNAAESGYTDRLASATQHFDLSMSPDFQDEFAQAMFFPTTCVADN
jgi:uncharacterized 2Fe-2S/4Fe-4S cluster protein (DUF4445 family)